MNLAPVERALARAVEDGVFPGAVLLVARDGEILLERGAGTRWGAARPITDPTGVAAATAGHGADGAGSPTAVTVDTRYDLSSLTKALATAPLVFGLVDAGRLTLDDAVQTWLPEFVDAPGGAGRESVRVRHLLAHSAGLPAHRPYFRELRAGGAAANGVPVTAKQAAGKWLIERALAEPLDAAPGERAVYSDLGFILLGEISARILGEPLDASFAARLALPLGLTSFGFVRVPEPSSAGSSSAPGTAATAVAPTECCPWRGRTMHGEVHDENAWAMGGVAGHAGLFGTAREVHVMASALERADAGGRGEILSPDAVREMWRRDVAVPGSTRTFGWDTPVAEGSSSGRFMSPYTVGHLGFTGTSLWIDRARGIHVILLSNRVHPSRDNQAIRAFRPVIHDLVLEALR